MARAAATSVENNFVKGLITEATGMNFPENSCSETYDCVFRPIGAVVRRPGFAPETGAVEQTITTDTSSVYEYVWRNVSNLGELTFVVQQVGMTLYFFEVSGDALSPGLKSSTVSLSTYRTSGAPTTGDTYVCQFATGDGKLFVTHPYLTPFYIEYDSATNTLTATAIDITIRDFRRQADGYAADEHPATLTNLHKYNLYNQGWYITSETGAGNMNVLQYWDNSRSDFPSNADIWWLFKDADDKMENNNFTKVVTGNTLAPNGHYILNPFNTDRGFQAGLTDISEDSAGSARPSACAFYAGRLWLGGVRAVGYGDKLYFTQILENKDQIGKCYQNNDPTSMENSDLLPSDGGVLMIQGMGTLIGLRVVGSALVVLASNGVWSVSGGQGLGFLASDYSIQKLSPMNAASHMSIVEAEGSLLWWNYDGIYLLASDGAGGAKVQSATDPTIKTFYNDIPRNNINFVKGAYNPNDMLVQWLFRSTVAATDAENFKYDRVLNLRTNTQAFYPWTISTAADVANAPSVSGIVCITGSGVSRIEELVVDGSGNTVTI